MDEYILVFKLVNTVTVYTPGTTDPDYGKKSNFTNAPAKCRIFGKRDRLQITGPKVDYDYKIYMKTAPSEDSRIYIGETAETDPDKVKAAAIKFIKPLFGISGAIEGYKVHI